MAIERNWSQRAGWVLSGLIFAMLALSAIMKLMGSDEVIKGFAEFGLADWRIIIGIGEVASAVLFLFPPTAVIGTLLLSSYFGGAILAHMSHGQSIIVPSVILLLIWFAAGLRMPGLFRAGVAKA